MGRLARSLLQSVLKLVNSVIGLAGMGMTLYSLWMIRSWYKHIDDPSFGGPDSSPPWFIYTFLGLGISLCLITCSGHIAAETANGHCLSCISYWHVDKGHHGQQGTICVAKSKESENSIAFIHLSLLDNWKDKPPSAYIFLNRDWEEDFPEDPTGKFDELKNFVRSNFEMCKWIGSLVVAAQALSIFMAMVLRALGPDSGTDYESDDDSVPARLPLLRNQVQQSHAAVPNNLYPKNDSWNVNR